jgi:hypothetical protein
VSEQNNSLSRKSEKILHGSQRNGAELNNSQAEVLEESRTTPLKKSVEIWSVFRLKNETYMTQTGLSDFPTNGVHGGALACTHKYILKPLLYLARRAPMSVGCGQHLVISHQRAIDIRNHCRTFEWQSAHATHDERPSSSP